MSEKLRWWNQLTYDWKLAFASTFFLHDKEPSDEELEILFNATSLRFTGPKAPFPNMSFELTDLSGIEDLHQLQLLIVTHHQIGSITPLASLKKLNGLFLLANRIESLSGIEDLRELEQLYLQENKITSLKPVEHLTNLKELFINNNCLTSLDGLTEDHSDKLTKFHCRPGNDIKQKEIIRVENSLGIRCLGRT